MRGWRGGSILPNNISFDVDGGKFNLRTAGIIIQSNKILLCKNDGNSNYYTIGGRIKFGEDSVKAIEREVMEETKQRFIADRLLYVNENFFTFQKTQEKCHEICTYYLMKSLQPVIKLPQPIQESYGIVRFYWIHLNELTEIVFFPEFLKSGLQKITSSTKHIVIRQ